jgi:hypothetical protein
MSKLGGATAFAAEAGLWVAGAALIASAAGAHWHVDMPTINLNGLTGTQSSSAPSANGSPTFALRTLEPGAAPTVSPLVAKYQAYASRTDAEMVGKFVDTGSAVVGGKTVNVRTSGTTRSKGNATASSQRETYEGTVLTRDTVSLGKFDYESINSGAWTKKARANSSKSSHQFGSLPSDLLLDRGVETKNGLQLHRLEIADSVAFSKSMVSESTEMTDAQFNITVWVDDEGMPAAYKMEGWAVEPINGVSSKVAIVYDLRVIATSGVTITAPI